MTTSATPDVMDLDAYGDAIGRAATVLRANVAAAGLDAPVPTCPGWTARDLVVHQGMVHRWAAGHLRGDRDPDAEAFEAEGRAATDVLDWFDSGATDLLQAIVDAPEDLDALVFLRDAPAPRRFWARRQAHETSIHAVDALAARLGRPPRPEETWLRDAVALDGIDELLRGFVPRGRRTLDRAARLVVRPEGSRVAWAVDVRPGERAVTERLRADETRPAAGDGVLEGPAVRLYLDLWNRGPDPEPGSPLEWWRQTVAVRWS